jgi:hypothetical protein
MKTMRHLGSLSKCALVITAMHSTQASATLFDCTTVAGMCVGEGDTVIFQFSHTGDSMGDDYMGLFGQIQYSGDTVFVTPTDFRAESIDGTTLLDKDGDGIISGTTDIAYEAGTIQILAKEGYVLDHINIGETGDYKMSTGGTSVDVDAYLRVFDWFDAAPVFGTEETMYLDTTDFTTAAQGTVNPVSWDASGSFDLTTAMWDDRDHVGLTLQNTLTAVSSAEGEFAWIQKKAVGSEIIVSTSEFPPAIVPIPAAAWLFGSGLLGLIGIARRKKAA